MGTLNLQGTGRFNGKCHLKWRIKFNGIPLHQLKTNGMGIIRKTKQGCITGTETKGFTRL